MKSISKDTQIANTSGSGSGIRFAAAASRQTQLKDPTKKREVKGKESQTQAETRLTSSKVNFRAESGLSLQPNSGSKSKKVTAAAAVEGRDSPSSSVSPILASSLGLNRIKTRSGPLPQESFFGFRSDRGSTLGASNLSRPGGDGGSGSRSGGKKKELSLNQSGAGFQESFASGALADNGSNSDSMSAGSALSRDQSPNIFARPRLQNGESSSEAGRRYYN